MGYFSTLDNDLRSAGIETPALRYERNRAMIERRETGPMHATQIDLYEKAQVSDGSVHMLWTEDGTPRQMLCGRSNATAVTADLLRARVTCTPCRERALAIVAGENSPR